MASASEREDMSSPITIQNMYDITNRNYEWESFKYQVPRHYASYKQKQVATSNKILVKQTYIDDVLKVKKFVPAPNKYQIKENYRPLSGKMDKNPRKTLAETIMHQSKREPSPAPTSYFTRPKTAESIINKNVPHYRQHYLNQVQYLSAQSPGVGEYNVNYFKGDHIKGPKYSKGFSTSKSTSNLLVKKQKSMKKQQKQQISKTLVIGTFDWIASQAKSTNKNYFGKSKRFVLGNQLEKKPGPNFYKLNTKWTDETNILKTSASTKSMKSVYYS